MEKVRLRLYQLVLTLTLASLMLTLANSGKQREFFYFSVYASIIGLFIEWKKINLSTFSIALPILLTGVINLCWYFAYEYHNEGINTYNEYLMASKKLILGSILVFYLDRFRSYISAQTFQGCFLLASGTGFFLASIYALWQVTHGMVRAEMGINRATVSAYIYSVLSLSFIYSLYLHKKVALYVMAGMLTLFSWYIILLTGTRAAMGLFFIFSILLTMYHFRKIPIKSIAIFFASIIVLVLVSYKPYIKPKIDQTVTEIHSFHQGQDDTSLGARFSMWVVGVENGLAYPLGQSMGSREQWTGRYVKEHPNFSSSMLYIHVHLHNEFIEKFSLQGVPGVIFLAFLFVSLLLQGFRKQNAILLMTTISLLLYGMTDVILLSSEALIFFLVMFALSISFNSEKFILQQ
ncbi:O-antigen ligase family protein [Trabulsiella odontotermitis]|uniref:Ligase n=1 Tax=Trabulsiella odontotermitis TaxID=379893 RepID=A0A0L0GYL7_9ENTR|nr:O-antigen ligase family protein [Trabulsiella odontotermitis]KNC94290.1 ligase [Trabulsiella odontotermitis]